MAVTVVDNTIGVSTAVDPASSPVTMFSSQTINTGTNRCMIVICSVETFHATPLDVTGVTWNGNSLTEIVQGSVSGDHVWIFHGVESVLDADTADLAVTFTGGTGGGGNTGLAVGAIVFGNVDQTTPVDTVDLPITTDTASNTSIQDTIGASAGCAIVSGIVLSGVTTPSVDDETAIFAGSNASAPGWGYGGSYELHAGAGTATIDWTFASNPREVLCLVEVLQAAAVTDDDPPFNVLPSNQLRGPRRVVAY